MELRQFTIFRMTHSRTNGLLVIHFFHILLLIHYGRNIYIKLGTRISQMVREIKMFEVNLTKNMTSDFQQIKR